MLLMLRTSRKTQQAICNSHGSPVAHTCKVDTPLHETVRVALFTLHNLFEGTSTSRYHRVSFATELNGPQQSGHFPQDIPALPNTARTPTTSTTSK
jgi:hypothetical protein